jgi:hypothetical protein
MQPLVQRDAFIQTMRMTEMLSDGPTCRVFKERMLEAEKGSPYEGSTEWKLMHNRALAPQLAAAVAAFWTVSSRMCGSFKLKCAEPAPLSLPTRTSLSAI